MKERPRSPVRHDRNKKRMEIRSRIIREMRSEDFWQLLFDRRPKFSRVLNS